MEESEIVFIRDTGLQNEATGRDMIKLKEDFVKFINRTGGVVEINVRGPREELSDAYAFFSGANDMEGIGMDIASSGARWNHYFRGISAFTEDEDGYKFKVTLQIRDAPPR